MALALPPKINLPHRSVFRHANVAATPRRAADKVRCPRTFPGLAKPGRIWRPGAARRGRSPGCVFALLHSSPGLGRLTGTSHPQLKARTVFPQGSATKPRRAGISPRRPIAGQQQRHQSGVRRVRPSHLIETRVAHCGMEVSNSLPRHGQAWTARGARAASRCPIVRHGVCVPRRGGPALRLHLLPRAVYVTRATWTLIYMRSSPADGSKTSREAAVPGRATPWPRRSRSGRGGRPTPSTVYVAPGLSPSPVEHPTPFGGPPQHPRL